MIPTSQAFCRKHKLTFDLRHGWRALAGYLGAACGTSRWHPIPPASFLQGSCSNICSPRICRHREKNLRRPRCRWFSAIETWAVLTRKTICGRGGACGLSRLVCGTCQYAHSWPNHVTTVIKMVHSTERGVWGSAPEQDF